MHHVAQALWRQHLDPVAPHVQVPAHLQVTGREEAYDQRAVRLLLHLLGPVELETTRMVGRSRKEAPNDLAELVLVLEHTEGAIGERLEVEGRVALEALRPDPGRADILHHVETHEVREGMETAWASNGSVVLRSAQRPDYGVKLSGGAEGKPLQVRAIGFGQPGARRDVARDRDAEALWCSDFQGLEGEITAGGGSLSVDIAQPAGLIPIEIVEEALPDSRQDTGRRAPLRQAKR